MKITFLGTGGAQGVPSPYCDCLTCTHARRVKGKNIRKRSSYFVNDEVLVDMGPDFFMSAALHDVNMFHMRYTLITHGHLDHFFVQNLGMRAQRMHKNTKLPRLTLVAPPSVMALLNQYSETRLELERQPITPYETVQLSPYQVKAIKASHYHSVGDAVNYIISNGKRKVMIASDTGVYEEDVWAHLEDAQLDMLIIECTRGLNPKSSKAHLNIKDMQMMIKKMKDIHALTEDTVIYATHFSHQNCPSHEELEQTLLEIGVHCAYDGLVVNI